MQHVMPWNTTYYPSHYLVKTELRSLMRELNVTKYRLGQMLGIPKPFDVYRWFSGHCRPSAVYLTRMLHLRSLHAAGRLDAQAFDGYTYWAVLDERLAQQQTQGGA
ncbi:MAG: helix-turn-helix transcriptional regulator [Candidatus Nitrosotenuis sp.]